MKTNMKSAYRLFLRKRSGIYYVQNNATGEQRSLNTKDKAEAERLWQTENQARNTPALNLALGRVYLNATDPKLASRTWREVMDKLSTHGIESSQRRCQREMQSKPFVVIRNKNLVETTGEDFRLVLKRGGSSTNNYLRRLHNLALNSGFLTAPIMLPKQWGKAAKVQKRAITFDEHNRIIAAEQNDERKLYYELLWLIGAAQTDGSLLRAENINWETRILTYQRKKTKQWCFLQIGSALETLLRKLPSEGFLFPKIATLSENDRSAEFYRRCKILQIKGVSLHSYRYAWAERAFTAGYAERFAQAALGHSSRVVHHGYAKSAKVVCPPLESVVIPFPESQGIEASKKVA